MNSTLKISSILSAAIMLFVPAISFGEQTSGITNDIKYTLKFTKNKHLVHFDVCSTSQDLVIPKVTVKSPQETKEVKTQKFLKPNTCQSYDVTIKAKYANQIEVITQ